MTEAFLYLHVQIRRTHFFPPNKGTSSLPHAREWRAGEQPAHWKPISLDSLVLVERERCCRCRNVRAWQAICLLYYGTIDGAVDSNRRSSLFCPSCVSLACNPDILTPPSHTTNPYSWPTQEYWWGISLRRRVASWVRKGGREDAHSGAVARSLRSSDFLGTGLSVFNLILERRHL